MSGFNNLFETMSRFDLAQDYSNVLLSDAGELEVPNTIQHPLYLLLGQDVVLLTIMQGGAAFATPGTHGDEVVGYTLENLTAGTTDAALLFDNERVDASSIGNSQANERFKVWGGKVLTLGRDLDCTPDLQFSESVSRIHAQIRTGNMRGQLHFQDLDSRNGTSVYVHPHDVALISPPRRTLRFMPGGLPKPVAQVEQRWLRPPIEKAPILSLATTDLAR